MKSFIKQLLLLLFITLSLIGLANAKEAEKHSEEEKSVHAFLENYFATWSAQDMKGYGECFDPKASIHMIDDQGNVYMQLHDEFLAGQAEAHRRSLVKMVEVPLSFQIEFSADNRIAKASVTWKLTTGSQVTTGVDHYTLRRSDKGWKILDLTFYEDKK